MDVRLDVTDLLRKDAKPFPTLRGDPFIVRHSSKIVQEVYNRKHTTRTEVGNFLYAPEFEYIFLEK